MGCRGCSWCIESLRNDKRKSDKSTLVTLLFFENDNIHLWAFLEEEFRAISILGCPYAGKLSCTDTFPHESRRPWVWLRSGGLKTLSRRVPEVKTIFVIMLEIRFLFNLRSLVSVWWSFPEAVWRDSAADWLQKQLWKFSCILSQTLKQFAKLKAMWLFFLVLLFCFVLGNSYIFTKVCDLREQVIAYCYCYF